MNFEEKLKQQDYEGLWQAYCGFLELSPAEFMVIQNRLMLEQIQLWQSSPLGQSLLPGEPLASVEAFREKMPLTTYEDYADILLQRRSEMLPGEPVVWIQTTWEGGRHPIKVAPYTKSMLDTYKNNVMTIFMLATSQGKGRFDIRPRDKMLYGLAPLPYATGLLPLLLNDEVTLDYLPAVEEAQEMTFSQRNKKGFELGLQKGIDLFFGLSSVAHYISANLSNLSSQKSGKLSKLRRASPKMVYRMLKASYVTSKENRPIKPKDLFKLKGFVCAGTDSHCYKDALEDYWGVRPLEIAAGTEPTCVATETWLRQGMYFFPDACFYEFIPDKEMHRSLEDSAYQPRTYLMDEVVPHENYELVVTVLKGGAFVRYRVGDVYRCLGVDLDQSPLPRFAYVDRVPNVIDIAGFTRITEKVISEVIRLSGIETVDWVAAKEYTTGKQPYMHLYVELSPRALESRATSRQVLTEHLSVYFKYFDSDYHDLKRLLGVDPLEITILKSGTFEAYAKSAGKGKISSLGKDIQSYDQYKKSHGRGLRRINPSRHELIEFLRFQDRDYELLDEGRKGGSLA